MLRFELTLASASPNPNRDADSDLSNPTFRTDRVGTSPLPSVPAKAQEDLELTPPPHTADRRRITSRSSPSSSRMVGILKNLSTTLGARYSNYVHDDSYLLPRASNGAGSELLSEREQDMRRSIHDLADSERAPCENGGLACRSLISWWTLSTPSMSRVWSRRAPIWRSTSSSTGSASTSSLEDFHK